MKILSVVGARPEFIQATIVSRAIRETHQEILVHTGQHYDISLSQSFFKELEIPSPDYNLEVGSNSHAQQTGKIMIRMEKVLQDEQPDIVIVRGDTNSTMASALAASKLQILIAHIEAGERSHNRSMPEEINRLVTDRLADLHFCTSQTAMQYLALEGIKDTVYWVGDVMLDAMFYYRPIAQRRSNILERMNLASKNFCLVTIHRAANTDEPERLKNIVDILNEVSEIIVFPVHPRTSKALAKIQSRFEKHVRLIGPVGYLDMLMLEEHARLIATDSGGVQREAYFLGIPCLTLRDETEWIETVEAGWNKVVGTDPEQALYAWKHFAPPEDHPPLFGEGIASQRIAHILDSMDISSGYTQKEETGVNRDHKLKLTPGGL
ncbi:MAG: UDP-N-acetylglucosamine 2-epimerase [Chloroflexi bacterium RBG_16_48_8]|nr:MAG: UDP-N-acetylglucosamine 2-epimerase [Chloroflexi bacterium RBG_16_48_8]